MGLNKLEEILEGNLAHQYIQQEAIESIALCCKLFANQKDKGDLKFLIEMKGMLRKNDTGYLEVMIRDWINELESKLNDK